MFQFLPEGDGGVSLDCNGKLLLQHSSERPALFLGRGSETIESCHGNFDIRDRVSQRIALRFCGGASDGRLRFTHPDLEGEYVLLCREENGVLRLTGHGTDQRWNRLWLRFPAEPGEHVMGGGEQFSYLDLRGKLFPIWTREQGVGRNKLTEVTRLADVSDGGGGDYHTTYFPQPTFVSSRMYFVHLENYEYAELDFRGADFHELGVWSTGISLYLGAAVDYPALLERLTGLLGRQPALPDWALRGLWLGVQGGTERAKELLNRCRDGGIDISAVWTQDWSGRRVTSFGKRLQWDWRWNQDRYPDLDKVIRDDPEPAWMVYMTSCLVEDGVLFREAAEHDYFVKRPEGGDYLVDFGEFNCGFVDLSLPEAFDWYKRVIQRELLDLGFRGWMADFGEYLPADAVCHGGSGLALHNEWPLLWAKCCREAVEEAGKLGDCVFFMRAGAAGSQRYATLVWAGDQCVDWSADDGLPSVITAALSLGMSGYGLHTSDIGGYTTLFHLKRDRELLLRWLEFACFTPVMRTHEGNRPSSNVQLYDDDALIAAAARLTRIHGALLPYLKRCVRQNAETGLPVMRPLFFAAPQAEEAYDRGQYSYLLGDDALAAPVVEPGAETRRVWLPAGPWEHLWSGEIFPGGRYVTVPAPMGKPPVFFRPASEFAPLFRSVRNI